MFSQNSTDYEKLDVNYKLKYP